MVPTVRSTNQPSGCKCCCLHTASTPGGRKKKYEGESSEKETESPALFSQVAAYPPRRKGLLDAEDQQEASESCGPRSDSATLDGVCLCPRDRSASAGVWGTLSDDSVCVIYELWKGCISSTHGRPHGKWRNSEFINIQ